MSVVPFQMEHREGILRIHVQTFEPLALSSRVWQPCQQVESLDRDCLRFVNEEEGLKGYVAAYRLDDTHFRMNLIVHPDHTGRGIGTILLDKILSETEAAGGQYLQARLLENMPSSRAFMSTRGFTEVHVMRGMSLHSRDFTFDMWEPLGVELSARGLVMTTLRAEFERNRDPIENLAKLHWFARQGWPSPDPTLDSNASIESCRSLFTDMNCPEYFAIMKCGAEYAGYTCARNRMSLTAVHPDYRGIGVATYLKARNLRECINAGDDHFESATANPAMQRVNEKLGYKLNGVAEVRFLKML